MLTFQPVTKRSLPRLRRYYKNCTYQLCEYSAGVKLMWRKELHTYYAEVAGCLVSYSVINGKICFDFPFPGENGDVEAALCAIEQYCVEKELPLTISVVPESFVAKLALRYPRFHMSNYRAWGDYIYRKEDLCEFSGRRYSGQRNHINQFKKRYPQAVFLPLGEEDIAHIEEFWKDYEAGFSKKNQSARDELRYAKDMFYAPGMRHFCVGGIEWEGKLLSLCLAERCGDTLIIHIEKGLAGYEGVYPTTVQAFAQHFATEDIHWINREDDAGDKGVRMSKRQYLPEHLGAKVRFDVENELAELHGIPQIKTDRLLLNALTQADQDAYNALCLDEERNRWWGYDYHDDLKGALTPDYFLKVAQEDFMKKTAVNFAVRLDGQYIGEVILYHFDGKGNAELGCRIAPAFAHHGYGTEAFSAVADWALYHLKLSAVVAKCYRENEASFRMLSSCMRKEREDETYFYFKKEV